MGLRQQQESYPLERVSAVMDGEDAGALKPWLGELSDEDRAAWTLYHAIGDTLRSDDLAMSPAASLAFTARLSERLVSEPHLLVPAASRPARSLRRRVLPGVAVAAAAAFVWGVAPPLQGLLNGGAAPQVARSAAAPMVQSVAQRTPQTVDADLEPYLQAHQGLAPDPMVRTGLMNVSASLAGR